MNSILARIPQMLRRIGCCAALALCTMAVGFALPASGAPSVSTDKADYPPGATATNYGSGWAAGEVVTLQVTHADGTPNTGAEHLPWTVIADGLGNFTTTWHVCEDDCVGKTLLLTAIGPISGTATATFTDGQPAANLDQIRNGGVGCNATPCTACTASVDWVNGNAGQANSHYNEGQSVAYRVTMKNLG